MLNSIEKLWLTLQFKESAVWATTISGKPSEFWVKHFQPVRSQPLVESVAIERNPLTISNCQQVDLRFSRMLPRHLDQLPSQRIQEASKIVRDRIFAYKCYLVCHRLEDNIQVIPLRQEFHYVHPYAIFLNDLSGILEAGLGAAVSIPDHPIVLEKHVAVAAFHAPLSHASG